MSFQAFDIPDAHRDVQTVAEECMMRYQTEEIRRTFSNMVIKKPGQMRVHACTLVDDDEAQDLGGSLARSVGQQIRLRHHRCYSCFRCGSSCNEL